MFRNFLTNFKNAGLRTAVGLSLLIVGYVFYLQAVQSHNFRLFDPARTISWRQSQDAFFRKAAKGNVESILLSEHQWRDYRLSLEIRNPQNCGLVFDHVDAKNYSFVYFQNHHLVIGHLRQGKTEFVKNAPYPFTETARIAMTRSGQAVDLHVNQQKVFSQERLAPDSRFGLMLNQINDPPTVFQGVSLEGRLGSGPQMRFPISGQEARPAQPWQSLTLFYFAFVLIVIFCSGSMMAVTEKIAVALRHVPFWAVHIGLAVCFFWPFVSRGDVAVFSYDNIGEIYPLFLYNKQNFGNILQGQAPWLWNPLVHNGFPFFSNHWNMLYDPLNWPVFLVPDRYVFFALTLRSFVLVAVVGMLAYGFFKREFGHPGWALFSSVVYQMCSLLIFTMSLFPATSLYFAMTLYVYVLWSAPQRRAVINLLLLTLSVVLILTSANVAFIFYACLAIGTISLYRLSVRPEAGRTLWLLAGAWISGILISAVRIFSCLEGVLDSNRVAENFQTIHDRSFMVLRLFIPEITGWLGPQAFPVLTSENLNLVFRHLDMPSNSQNNFFIYFGVLPALFLLINFVTKADAKALFWKVYALTALAVALLLQPVWGVLSILSFPLNHYSYHTIILPIGICAAIGYAGMAWERGEWQWSSARKPVMIALGGFAAYVIVFLTYVFPRYASLSRCLLVLLIVFVVGSLWREKREIISAVLSKAAAILHGGALTLLVCLTLLLAQNPLTHKEKLVTGLVLPLLWFAAIVVLVLTRSRVEGPGTFRAGWEKLALILPFVFAAVLAPFLGPLFNGLAEGVRVYVFDVTVGVLRFYFLTVIGVLLISGAAKKTFSKQAAFVLLLVLTIFDLVVFNARFNDIAAPFYYKQAFYPQRFSYQDIPATVKGQMDLVNFRVSRQDHWDQNANKNLIFGVPSYTGTLGYMTQRYSRFLTNFGYPQGIYMLYPEDAPRDGRFLDLCAVRYVFNEEGGISQRDTSLGRLNFYFAAEFVASDEQTLAVLRDSRFDHRKVLVLSQPRDEGIRSIEKSSQVIPINASDPDRIAARFTADQPGYVFFAESYHAGWKAFLNGEPVPVIRANYNFMAVPVLATGPQEIRFIFQPASFYRNSFISLFGIAFLIGVVIFAQSQNKGRV